MPSLVVWVLITALLNCLLIPGNASCPQGCDRDSRRWLLRDDDHRSRATVIGLMPELQPLLNTPPAPPEARLAR